MDDAQLAKRLGAIERQLTLVSERLGIDCPPFVGDSLPSDADRADDGQSAIGNADTSPWRGLGTRPKRSAAFAI